MLDRPKATNFIKMQLERELLEAGNCCELDSTVRIRTARQGIAAFLGKRQPEFAGH